MTPHTWYNKEADLVALSEENLSKPIEIVTDQWAGRLENPCYSTTKNPAAWEHGQTYFDLTVDRPVAGTTEVSFYFRSNVIEIPRDGPIGKVMAALPGAKFDGWRVLLGVNPEAAERIEAITRAFSRQRTAEQAAVEITEWVFTSRDSGRDLEIYPVPDAYNSKVIRVKWTAKEHWGAKDLVKVAQPLDREPPAFAAYGNEHISPNSAFGWYRISDEVIGAMIAEKEAVPVASWRWVLDGCTHAPLVAPEPGTDTPSAKDLKRYVRENFRYNDLAPLSVRIDTPEGCARDTLAGWWRIPDADLHKLVNDRKAAVAARKVAIDAKVQAAYEAALATAKETGKPALLRQWNEECHENLPDCDLDTCALYVLPDGSEKVYRSHCY